MNLSAIGFTALPDIPDIADFPFTTGSVVNRSLSISIIDLTVLIADIPSAPPLTAAIAEGIMLVIFGVILAITAIFVALLAAFVYFSTSSGLQPTSEPMLSRPICGHDMFSSTPSIPI